MSPQAAAATPVPRQAARAAQQQREQQRLMRRQQWGIALLCATPSAQKQHVQAAHQVVERWRAEQLCGADYIERWQQWLALPVTELVKQMCGDANGWGNAMRQNSPFTATPPIAP